MKDTARTRSERQEARHMGQLALAAMLDARATLYTTLVQAGMGVISAMLEEDRARIWDPRYAHDPKRAAHRAGHADGELALGARRVRVRRPRVRGTDGREVALPTWERFACDDPLSERAVEQMVLGVSTRNYARSLEPLPREMPTRGASKSAVSRRFVGATSEVLTKLMSRDLSAISLAAIIIDGIHMGEHLIVVALGIDEQGDKHVLGLQEGATENEAVCKMLLEDIVARGVRANRSMLFVVDGSKALAAAIHRVFGKRSLVQPGRRSSSHWILSLLAESPHHLCAGVGRPRRPTRPRTDQCASSNSAASSFLTAAGLRATSVRRARSCPPPQPTAASSSLPSFASTA